MKWKHIKLNYKLGIGFGALIFLLSVISLFAVNGITSMLVQNKDVMEINHLEAGFLKNHEQHFSWLTTLNTIILKQETGHMHLETDDHNCAFGQWYYSNERKQAEKLLPGIKPILDDMEEHHQELHKSAIGILNDVNTGNVEAATQNYLDVSLPIIDVLGEHFDNLEEVTHNNRVEIEKQFNVQADQTRKRVVLLAVLAIIFSIFITYAISRSILRPIKRSVTFSEEIAEGNLNAQIDIEQNDEIGMLVKSLQKMGNNLEQIIGDIKAGSFNIQHAGQQMSDTSQQISESSTEHASSIEEISSTMEEMAANIQQNADNAKETEKISQNALEGIQDANNKSHDAFQANKMITEKINIITDIAFQTNILALNAAVEAARAGEHGKGFAVVAAEVRKLAERSKVAADEINDLAGKSFELSDSAGKKLDNMVPEIEKTSRLIQEIAASSEEQNNGATQVNQSIQQLNQITQTNAAVAEEMASSAEELSGQSESLLDLVSRFKISNDITHHGGGSDILNSKLTENVNGQKSMLNSLKTNGNGSGNGKILNTQPKQNGSNKVFINLKNDDSEFERY